MIGAVLGILEAGVVSLVDRATGGRYTGLLAWGVALGPGLGIAMASWHLVLHSREQRAQNIAAGRGNRWSEELFGTADMRRATWERHKRHPRAFLALVLVSSVAVAVLWRWVFAGSAGH